MAYKYYSPKEGSSAIPKIFAENGTVISYEVITYLPPDMTGAGSSVGQIIRLNGRAITRRSEIAAALGMPELRAEGRHGVDFSNRVTPKPTDWIWKLISDRTNRSNGNYEREVHSMDKIVTVQNGEILLGEEDFTYDF